MVIQASRLIGDIAESEEFTVKSLAGRESEREREGGREGERGKRERKE